MTPVLNFARQQFIKLVARNAIKTVLELHTLRGVAELVPTTGVQCGLLQQKSVSSGQRKLQCSRSRIGRTLSRDDQTLAFSTILLPFQLIRMHKSTDSVEQPALRLPNVDISSTCTPVAFSTADRRSAITWLVTVLYRFANLSQTYVYMSERAVNSSSGPRKRQKPTASHVVQSYIRQRNYPSWTSFFMRRSVVVNDQWGMSSFNMQVDGVNYHVLRTGCWPFLKYHCTQREKVDLEWENRVFRFIKLMNLGLLSPVYGILSAFFISHKDEAVLADGEKITIYFLLKETW